MKKKTLIIIGVIAVLLIAVLVGGKKAGWFGGNPNIKQVEVTKIEPLQIVETVAATGKIQPETEVKISSEVSGEIIELPIAELKKTSPVLSLSFITMVYVISLVYEFIKGIVSIAPLA